jgi:hypothetical protein
MTFKQRREEKLCVNIKIREEVKCMAIPSADLHSVYSNFWLKVRGTPWNTNQ